MASTRFSFGSYRSGAISILLMILLFLTVRLTTSPRRPTFVQVHGEGELRSHIQSTGEVAFTLMPGAFYSFKFVVPVYHEDASLKGEFSVAGQDDRGIEAFVLNEVDYANWQNGYATYRYYESGNVQRGSMDVPLLADTAGTYYVVFNNRLPEANAKSVRAKINLLFLTRWWPGMDE